ncbi:MAG: restriction endonuclease subunit S, partial [Pyramidobacter sp.]|nr:restriction endonuclease subunit S [Pyramidobacter sp.]
MTPKELKNAILQLAIQGKLVEQRPEEETAAELYARIQAEKRALIAAGKLKKEKPLPEIADDEKPFDLPEGWMWCYLGDLFQHNTGKALNSSDRDGTSLSYITTSNLYWNRFELSNLKEMLFTEAEIEKCTVQKGDLLVCEGGDFGRAAIWQNDEPVRIQNHIHRLRAYAPLAVEYFYYVFFLYK